MTDRPRGNHPTTAMVLAAGRGERLRPLTDATPKPLLRVGDRPLLGHQLAWLQAAGFRRVVINLHHLGEQIEAYCGDGAAFGMEIVYSRETELLETGGGILQALPLLGERPFAILNGDIFTSFPLASLSNPPDWADIHMVLTPKPGFRERGDFEYESGRITSRGDSYVYCGIACLRADLFRGRSPGTFSFRDVFFAAVAAGRASAQVWRGDWLDIGSIEQLEAANRACAESRKPGNGSM